MKPKDQKKQILMPKQIIKNKFIKQLNILNVPQMNCLFLVFEKLQELKKFNWEKFKQNEFEIIININLIFSKEQLGNYIFKTKEFNKAKKIFEKLLNLNVWYFENEKLTMINLFSKLEFDYKNREILKLKITNDFIKEIDYFLRNNIYIKQSNLINSNISSLEIKFRILFLYLLSLQTDKDIFSNTIEKIDLVELHELLNVSKFCKNNFSHFNRFVFKPIIKKIKQTERFRNLEIDYKKINRKVSAIKFTIPPFNFKEKQQIKEQNQESISTKEQFVEINEIKKLVLEILNNKKII